MPIKHSLTTREALETYAKSGHPGEGLMADAFIRKQYVCEIKRVEAKEGDATDISRRRTFVISTASPDRDNDVVEVAGWQLENYRKNPVVLWAHDYRALPVGKAIEVGIRDGKLESTMEFADHEFANVVLRLVDGGFLRATSVGFRPSKYVLNEDRRGIDFTEQELLEFSIVPVPANPEALIVAREFANDIAQLRSWAKSALAALDENHGAEVAKEEKPPVGTKIDAADGTVATLKSAELVASIVDAVVARLAPKAEERGAACPACEKRGRKLSGANEARLRQAKDHIDAVLAQVAAAEDEPDDEDDEAESSKAGEEPCCAGCGQKSGNQCKGCGHFMCAEHTMDGHNCPHCAEKSVEPDAVVELADESDDAVALELAEEKDADIELSAEEISAAVRAAVGGMLGELVRNETQATINRLTGRVD